MLVPRPRPWTDGTDQTVGQGGVVPLTVPHAYAMYSGVVGYHLPAKLANAEKLSLALRFIP